MIGILSRMGIDARPRIFVRYSRLQNLPVVSRGVKAGYRDSFTRSRNSVDTPLHSIFHLCTPEFRRVFQVPEVTGCRVTKGTNRPKKRGRSCDLPGLH
ncbi:hypothetical protein B7G54_12775 [Burkholderia puraquae]|uniref:Uncharacterized protein n=1 Tax=Burkholderia puraquae TaxID=1904757 RepID=A0A1X1PIS4_9BURK|nr:hypothetical protein B7G54_12775 [Burkholderia puraquae]